MNLHFNCTQCGKCCHDLKLPLSVEEAIGWAGRGHPVQFLCDAQLPLAEGEVETATRRYRAERAFPARSGGPSVRVGVVLVAAFSDACPHLRSDGLCGDYERRPRTCRIYPAEVVPEIQLRPEAKACPSEAWTDDQPLLMERGALVSPQTRRLIAEHRAAILQDAPVKAAACALLGFGRAAVAGEGYAVHSPSPEAAVAALTAARHAADAGGPERRWSLATNRRETLRRLVEAGADAGLCASGEAYAGFFADEA